MNGMDKDYLNLIKMALLVDCSSQQDYLAHIQLSKAEVVQSANRFVDYAAAHYRLLPLIVSNLQTYDLLDALRTETKQYFLAQLKQATIKKMALNKQLNEIVALFVANNIAIILLKGTAFCNDLYPAMTCRLSNDVDILVKKADWQRANALLSGLMNYSKKVMPGAFEDDYEVTFKPKLSVGAEVDLHRGLVHQKLFVINEQDLWQQSQQHAYYANDLVRVLSPEYALLHQAIHAYKDMNFCKYNLVDVHLIITKMQPDFNKLYRLAGAVGAKNVLYMLLHNTAQYIQPNVIHADLKPIQPSGITSKLATKLLRSKHRQPFKNQKTLRYRIHQVIAQFVFLDSLRLALAFQCSYLRTVMNR